MQRKYIEGSGKVKIIVKGSISLVLGDELVLEVDDETTIRDIWMVLRDKFRDRAEEIGVYPALENLPSHNLILIDGIEISALNDLDTKIRPGDVIEIINYTYGG